MTLPTMARNFEYTYDGQTLTYTVLDEDAKTVQTKQGRESQGGNNVSGDLVIPSVVKDENNVEYTVRAIGDRAFVNDTELTSITIPGSVQLIDMFALYGCTGLTSVSIPNSVVTIGRNAFAQCTGLTTVTLSNSITEISDNVFYKCSALASITIPESVSVIAEYAFYGCASLTSVIIPKSVTEIRGTAFQDCTGLIKCAYPSTIANPFYSGVAIDYPAEDAMIEDGYIWNKEKTTLYFVPWDVTEFTIPESVTSIGNGAVSFCQKLTSVTFSNSVTAIGLSAFAECPALTSLTIGNSVQSIGDYAFSGCKSLTEATIPNSITSIGNWAYRDCTALTSVTYLAEKPIEGESDIFPYDVYNTATLNYLESAEAEIEATQPWSLFKNKIGHEGENNSIEEIVAPASSEATEIYNLRGVKVGNSLEGLAGGVYIVGGKKVLVK